MISTHRFNYNKQNNTFTACISDLHTEQLFKTLYDDAADIGFEMVSEKTGALATFYLSHFNEDAEGDITEWVCLPTTETERAFPQLRTATVIIFND